MAAATRTRARKVRPQASTMTLNEALERAGNDGKRLWVQEDGSIIIMNPDVAHKWVRRQRRSTGGA